MTQDDRIILLFDGLCGLCNGFVKFVIARDPKKRILFASQQSEVGISLMKRYGVASENLSTIILINEEEGSATTKSRAVFRILGLLKGFWPLLSVFGLLPTFITDRGYDFIARRRYKMFGKFDTCPIPEPSVRDRFI